MNWDWLVQDAPIDPETGEELDPPRFDGGPVAWGCLIAVGLGLLAVVGGAIILA